MTNITYYEAAVPPWADTAMTVAVEKTPVLTLYLKAVNYGTRRFYLGMEFYSAIPASALKEFRRLFAEAASGFELEALVARQDEKAQKFCTFFGFSRIPNYEVDKHFVYERLG